MSKATADSSAGERPLIEIESDAFDPWRIWPVRHRVSDHPLLRLEALVELGARMEAQGNIRTHANTAKADTPFNSAPDMFPNTHSVTETLRSIQDAKAWMSLLNVQTDPVYRNLIGDVLDSVRPQVEPYDPGMCHRAGWIFVSSPRTVTPFHFDKEHNFILQIQGRKRVYVWDKSDSEAASEHARDLFHDRHERYLLRWSEELRSRAHIFDLGPGQGAYMPSTSPHLVENGDEPSITVSFTYYTDATRRDAQLHKAHAMIRRVGVVPPAVGTMPVLDGMTHAGINALISVRTLARRALRSDAGGCARFAEVEA